MTNFLACNSQNNGSYYIGSFFPPLLAKNVVLAGVRVSKKATYVFKRNRNNKMTNKKIRTY